MKRFWLILVAMLGFAASAMPASAAVVYTLNCSNLACSSTSTTYGTVTLTQSGVAGSEKVNVSVQLTAAYNFSGQNNTLALVFNGATNNTLTFNNFSGNIDAGGSGSTQTQANGSLTASPFTPSPGGNCQCFDYSVQKSNSNNSPQLISFDVTKMGGLTLGNFTNNDNNGLYAFAAQIKTGVNGQSLFWVAAKGIPEPATWLLFFAAMAGLTVIYRRRKLARA